MTASGRALLGPCEDGGYYALGMPSPNRRVFEGIPWSTEQVAALSSPGRTGAALLHLPAGGLPSMAYETMIAAVRVAVEVALTTGADEHLAGGAFS